MIRLAWRGLWERKARTALTLIGVSACVLALSTLDGMLGFMRAERVREVARFTDRVMVQPHGAGYPPLKNTLQADSMAGIFDRSDILVEESTPLLFLILEPPDNPMDLAGVMGLGLWPGHETAWLEGVRAISGRARLEDAGDDGVVLGYRAARFYGVSTAGETFEAAEREWRVVGVLEDTGVSNVDCLVLMSLTAAQGTIGGEWVSAVLLTARDGQVMVLAQAIAEEYPSLDVNTQDEIRQVVLNELQLPDKFMGTLSWAAFVITVLIVTNVMGIAVRERTQEIDLIRATAGKRSTILGYTLAEAMTLSMSGGALGMLSAASIAYLFDWTWILNWGETLRVAGLVLVAGALAGVYPAFRAARAYPRALRYDLLRRQMEEVTAERQALGQAYRHLVRGREEERESLARELHDQAIQDLVGLKFHLAELVPNAQAGLQAEIDGVIGTLRELCADLRPPALDRMGLVATLRAYIDDFAVRTEMPVELRVEGEERRLSAETELAFFRVAQEALANARRHAQSPKTEVVLRFDEEAVSLNVVDRGRGFEVPEGFGVLVDAGHFGLMGMHERLELVGGTLRVTSEPSRGTTIVARVPSGPSSREH